MRSGNKWILLGLLATHLSAQLALALEEAQAPCECRKEGYPASSCTSGCDSLSATSMFVSVSDSNCYTWAGTPMSASCCTNGNPNNGAGCPSSSSVFVTTPQQIVNSAMPIATAALTTEMTHANSLVHGMGAILPSPKPSIAPAK